MLGTHSIPAGRRELEGGEGDRFSLVPMNNYRRLEGLYYSRVPSNNKGVRVGCIFYPRFP